MTQIPMTSEILVQIDYVDRWLSDIRTAVDWNTAHPLNAHDQLAAACGAEAALDELVHMLVTTAKHRCGLTWQEVGYAFDTTRQAAQQRFGSSSD